MPFRIKLKSKKRFIKTTFFRAEISEADNSRRLAWLLFALLSLHIFPKSSIFFFLSKRFPPFLFLFLSIIQLILFRCAPRSIGARQKPGKRTHPWRDRRLLRLSRHGPSISSSPRLAASGSSLFFFYSFIYFLHYYYLNDECSRQIRIREFSLYYYLKVRAAAQALVV